ncbi:unnamed protein product [Mytilus edulis]|uniref:Uncharacterized protein n=1 Tax=Mytilus edulis TaxID=6550 RepID=A0A8S3TC28_MYTED|nr:unnamed protein product [Mytilus edulis]
MGNGLNQMVRHDTIRQNDGPAMIRFWRQDMLQFHQHHHPKYLIPGHRLLTSINGWLPENQQNDLIWNRTVNYRGGAGHNLEMDLMNEFLNREFKDRIGSSANMLTEDVIARHAQLSGGIDQTLDSLFQYSVATRTADFHSNGPKRDNEKDRDLEDIIPDTPESTLRLNTGRNLFDYIQDIQQSVKELHQKFDRENKFRIEGGVKKELGVIAKAAFGTDIFNVSDCFIVSIA